MNCNLFLLLLYNLQHVGIRKIDENKLTPVYLIPRERNWRMSGCFLGLCVGAYMKCLTFIFITAYPIFHVRETFLIFVTSRPNGNALIEAQFHELLIYRFRFAQVSKQVY